MKKMKTLLAAAALTAISASAASAITIDFGSATQGPAGSLVVAQNGYTVTITGRKINGAGADQGASQVTQWATNTGGGGLGVTSGAGDNHAVDGAGNLNEKDLLVLTFDHPVTLNTASFTYVDGDEHARVWADGVLQSTVALLGHPSLVPLSVTGTVFAFGALTSLDSFKLRSIDVAELSPVPLPPAAALLATGLVGIGTLARRRNKKA